MKRNFRNFKGLVINSYKPTQTMLSTSLKLLGFSAVSTSYSADDGFRVFKEENPDVVIADIVDGATDGLKFTKRVREAADSPNNNVPVICIGGPQALRFADQASQIGGIEFLEVPYGVDDIANRLAYVLNDEFADKQHAQISSAQQAAMIEDRSERPDDEESRDLTLLLLEHYLRHHEIVLRKLKFAKDATKKSIAQLRNTGEKIQSGDQENMDLKSAFEKMWSEILQQFIESGVSENELKRIEGVITTIPDDIKSHYDALTNEDQSFLDLVEKLNTTAYETAKQVAVKVQSEPNILSGLTADDYKPNVKDNRLITDVQDAVAETTNWRYIKS